MTLKKILIFALSLSLLDLPGLANAAISAIWANNGEDKVTQDDLRATQGKTVTNSAWNGTTISLFGARNEVVAFNVILEAGSSAASNVTVSFNSLSGPSGTTITSSAATGDGVFNWVGRNIELFYVRYLRINGLSIVSYQTYDERHIPQRMRRPWSGNGSGSGSWTDRPDHNKYYPDIAVPLELAPSFSIASGSNQSIWADIYIPKSSPAGTYSGNFVVKEGGVTVGTIPVQLTVYNFTLPDTPSSKTMLFYSAGNIDTRYGASGSQSVLLRDRHYLLAHRHKISLFGDDNCSDQPCAESIPRLDGSLFTATNGYNGPGVNTGSNIYSIGTYGSWGWQSGTETDMRNHTNAWATWFNQNSPTTDYFLYLIDESDNYSQIQTWAQWILNNPGVGRQVRSFATMDLTSAASQTPSLDIPTSTGNIGITSQWQPLVDQYTNDARKRFYLYNGYRPYIGSTATEDDGVALRARAWGQYKKNINRWFNWESTYYNNYQGGTGETDVFQTAQAFGGTPSSDSVLGQTGWNYGNGEGVLFYPGTDKVYTSSSYGVNGPFASLRLKYWRRGIQDVDYLTMAAAVNPQATQTIVNQIVPKVLWEYGVDNPSDPTYVLTDISWSTNPDAWEAARLQLANIISGAPPASPPVITSTTTATGSVGTAFSYQITATNSPTSYSATGLPSGLSINTSLGTISGIPAAAGISTVTLRATNSAGTGTATLTLTVGSAGTTTIVLQKSATPSTARPGDTITFFIQYQNTGSGNATNSTITDVVPTGTTLISGTITGGGTISGGTITWNLGTVAGGSSGTVSFQARVN
ncbi:MAG: putative Ig domain-containing protein [Elusimicrobiota bacterium]|jgi:uncharacterized repeat protein (TIGR01451 family)